MKLESCQHRRCKEAGELHLEAPRAEVISDRYKMSHPHPRHSGCGRDGDGVCVLKY